MFSSSWHPYGILTQIHKHGFLKQMGKYVLSTHFFCTLNFKTSWQWQIYQFRIVNATFAWSQECFLRPNYICSRYEGLPGFRQRNMLLQGMEVTIWTFLTKDFLQGHFSPKLEGKEVFFQVCRIGLLFPVYSIAYILFPWLSASRIMRHVDQLRITDKQHKYHEGGSNMAILYEQFITRAARCHR